MVRTGSCGTAAQTRKTIKAITLVFQVGMARIRKGIKNSANNLVETANPNRPAARRGLLRDPATNAAIISIILMGALSSNKNQNICGCAITTKSGCANQAARLPPDRKVERLKN